MLGRLFAYGRRSYARTSSIAARKSVSWTTFVGVWLIGVVLFFALLTPSGVLHLMLGIAVGAGVGGAVLLQDRFASRIAHILIGITAGLAALAVLILTSYIGWWAFGAGVLVLTLLGHLGLRAARRDIMRGLADWRARR